MKRSVTLLVTAFVVQISGYLIKVPPTLTPLQPEAAPAAWVNLQKLVIPLFENVCEDSSDPVINSLAKEFAVDSTDDFSNPDVLPNLLKLISSKGLLTKGQIFTEYNLDHLIELQVIYELLYYAKSFEQFYKAASWSRQNLNCGLYVNAIYMAVQNRPDTNKISIPAPYELLPNYFIVKDAILRGVYISTGQNIEESEGIHVEANTYTIDANYTSSFYDNDDDSKLAYFREDIGLNSYYFLTKLKVAPWFNTDINGRYGEDVYHMMRQLMARYNLERCANGLPELENFSWNSTFDETYNPMLIYANGNEFIYRSAPVELPDNEDVSLVKTIENNIETVVSHMIHSGFNKTQILNHLMEILVTGDRSYETLARRLLGKDLNDNGLPSVLDHYMTSLRDPAFWKINYKIVDIVDNALKLLPSYTKNELYFPGVEIVNVDVKKIMTLFDYYEFDVTDALKVNESNILQVKIGQPRLNHKPFTVKITISSIVSQKSLVKIFLGPKLLPGQHITKKSSFFLLDQFDVNLKVGSNVVTRTSCDMTQFSEDFISLRILGKKVQDAEFGLNTLPSKTIESQIGYPSRLILPKGSSEGLPFQMFVFVAAHTKATIGEFYSVLSKDLNTAILSPGYPLDLQINYPLFELPNAFLKDVLVIHKGDNKIENFGGPGVTKKWYGGENYDPSSRPNYSAIRKEPFDYNSKKTQYEKNNDYLTKREEHITSDPIIETDHYETDSPSSKLLTSGFDWTSKSKGSFDYKSKKGQYGKKNYSKQDGYTDNNSSLRVDTTAGSKIKTDDNLAEKQLIKMDEISDRNLPEFKGIGEVRTIEYITSKPIIEYDHYETDSPPLKLLTSGFDWTSKSKGSFDYKSKKGQYGKKNYSKQDGYTDKNSSLREDTTAGSKEKTDDDFAENKLVNIDEISKSNIPESKGTGDIRAIEDITSEPIIKNDHYEIDSSPSKLLNSGFDWTSKNKGSSDYKSKKGQYGKKDYSKQDKYTDKSPSLKVDTIASSELKTDNDFIEKKFVNEEEISETNLSESEGTSEVKDDIQDNKIAPNLKVASPKKRITVYDYLFNVIDDSSEEKVYEK